MKYSTRISNMTEKIRTLAKSILKSRKRVAVFTVLLVILTMISWRIFSSKKETPQYQTVQVERGDLISSISSSGTVLSGNSATITSQATGVVEEVFVSNGAYVNKGQNIAKIILDQAGQQKQSAAWASYLSAQNSLNSAKSKMNSLQSALFTANQKFVNGAGTANPITDDPTYIIQRADWLQAESDYNNQKGVISAGEASLSSAWLSYAQTASTITAPITGTVSNLTLTPGMSIGGSDSNSQSFGFIVLKGGTPQASVNLSEIDVTKVAVGQKATLTLDAFAGKTFTGKVSTINTNGLVSSGVTNYPATVTFDTVVTNMYPNMAVSATIITDIKNNVILVPSGAVQTLNGESLVQVMKNNQVTSVTVEVGQSNDTQTEIVSGINEGDIVITGQTNTTTTGSTGITTSPFGNTRGGFGGVGGFGGGGAVRGGGGGR